MLKMRPEQIAAFEHRQREKYETKTVAHLREIFPTETSEAEGGEEEIRGWIRAGIERADSFGINRERDVTLFIDLDVGISAEFEKRRDMAWARDILEDDLPGTTKIDLIYELLPRKRSKKRSRRSG
ncbi:MAG: hypothetical protein AAF488_02685 [Planctomycetota bacterium]